MVKDLITLVNLSDSEDKDVHQAAAFARIL
jgi:hypothetical protein